MTAHFFDEAAPRRKLPTLNVRAGEALLAFLGLAIVVVAFTGVALWMRRPARPLPAPTFQAAPPPAAMPATPAQVQDRPAPRRRVHAAPAAPAPVLGAPIAPIPEADPFEGLERLSAAELEGISQAR